MLLAPDYVQFEIFFYPEHEDSSIFRIVGIYLTNYVTSHPVALSSRL